MCKRVADRRLAIFRAAKTRHIVPRYIVDRFDGPVADRDADQHRSDRFGHRLRDQSVSIGSSVLIMLEEYFIVLGDKLIIL
jgi:hypothetical protein